jgi:hypothetical protein
MRSTQLRFLLASLSACALGVVVLTSDSPGQEPYIPGTSSTGALEIGLIEGEREFSFSADPAFELLRVQYVGGAARRWSAFHLYADGRLVLDILDPAHQEILESFETNLSNAETENLLRIIVDAGFMESSRDSISDAVMQSRGIPLDAFKGHDSQSMLTTVHLESYRGPGQDEAAPATNQIKIQSPVGLSRSLPGVTEIEALATLHEALMDYARLAREGG